jgi:hypothetical protein
MLTQEANIGSLIVANPPTGQQNHIWKYREEEKQYFAPNRALAIVFFTNTKFQVFNVLPCEEKCKQSHFLAIVALEFSRANTYAKPIVGTIQLVFRISNSIYYKGARFKTMSPRKIPTSILHSFTHEIFYSVTPGSSGMRRSE